MLNGNNQRDNRNEDGTDGNNHIQPLMACSMPMSTMTVLRGGDHRF